MREKSQDGSAERGNSPNPAPAAPCQIELAGKRARRSRPSPQRPRASRRTPPRRPPRRQIPDRRAGELPPRRPLARPRPRADRPHQLCRPERPRRNGDRFGLEAMDQPIATTDKDAPLRYDIRLLGRILGEAVHAQEGDQTFAFIERIRQTALRFHRDADETARKELETIISGLPDDQAIRIIRAFGYFSHLANIAEDQHHIRRSRAYAMPAAAPRPA